MPSGRVIIWEKPVGNVSGCIVGKACGATGFTSWGTKGKLSCCSAASLGGASVVTDTEAGSMEIFFCFFVCFFLM